MPTSVFFKDDATRAAYYEDMKKYEQDLRKRYAPRAPMTQLRNEFRVTQSNLKPTLVHYGFPVDIQAMRDLAEENGLHISDPITCSTTVRLVKMISRKVGHPIKHILPFAPTADCDLILSFYTNFTPEKDILGEEEEKEVLRYLHYLLGLEETVSPKWYFDFFDPWKPPEESEDEGEKGGEGGDSEEEE